MKAVTKEFHGLLKQFLEFRKETWAVIDELKSYGEKMMISETLSTMQFPVYDFRYRADPDSPFKLYNCLTPCLKVDFKAPKQILAKFDTNHTVDKNFLFSMLKE